MTWPFTKREKPLKDGLYAVNAEEDRASYGRFKGEWYKNILGEYRKIPGEVAESRTRKGVRIFFEGKAFGEPGLLKSGLLKRLKS